MPTGANPPHLPGPPHSGGASVPTSRTSPWLDRISPHPSTSSSRGGASVPTSRPPWSLSLLLLLPFLLHLRASDLPAAPAPTHQTNQIEGWTLHIDLRLLKDEPDATPKAIELLRTQLQEIVRVVPAPAVARLREVPLWFSSPYPGVGARAEYHPDAGWLRSNHRNPAMARAVEFTDIKDFEAETRRMPNFTLHELAHGYHDRVLPEGFGNPELKAAHARAKASGKYDKVERKDAQGRSHTDRAYALVNPMEFFAESTEAFFTRNDFFPFNRTQLHDADPETEQLIGRLWGVPSFTKP